MLALARKWLRIRGSVVSALDPQAFALQEVSNFVERAAGAWGRDATSQGRNSPCSTMEHGAAVLALHFKH